MGVAVTLPAAAAGAGAGVPEAAAARVEGLEDAPPDPLPPHCRLMLLRRWEDWLGLRERERVLA